ncbi:hypothetical protein HPB52_013517 [Rhipicephalus sanguineus]|uniref:Uncharacterized protein n=1 Tax=Rhipicephalus sanguineus TaxID=34632 RepID=A0A9D4TA64_RHISA|nr:hypothetical protein HPB52_013517 [Rhipicephalus sanguineus]
MEDCKVGIRPRNGLSLAKINPMHLTAAIARKAGIPNNPKPFQLRIDEEQNDIVASTPPPAKKRLSKRYSRSTLEEVKAVIEAPGYEVLCLRRLGSSSALVITFKGKKSGHRADVCPNPPETPKCKDCGVTLSGGQHECHPRCGLCDGAHTTAAKTCPQRFLPTVNRTKPAAQTSPPPALDPGPLHRVRGKGNRIPGLGQGRAGTPPGEPPRTEVAPGKGLTRAGGPLLVNGHPALREDREEAARSSQI